MALNVPSQRYHDPSDEGGMLGHWKHGSVGLGPYRAPLAHQAHGSDDFDPMMLDESFTGEPTDAVCFDGGPLQLDPSDPAFGSHGKSEAPEVPWPRFHPVPVRPVFGAPEAIIGH
ncbi:hypothetical protein K227x_00210 [Rubripirellula lacrimiformis]|uniref:Uncharacterized protein n=1 Tax=Rubripirellula lacrimiformis TaxID=1930273 RepID=A0A517N3E3_9BACT|nr:hypothetical protein K227x_00210 [Rubripirellula lacrimiformis]